MAYRLDSALAARGLCPSRQKAKAQIEAGQVRVNGLPVSKPSARVSDTDLLEVLAAPDYVSRAGLKLACALERFGLDVSGLTVLDVGASTGGFTDCLLRHGAAKVYAVDVGHDQLADKLRHDPRVVSLEGQNARTLSPARLGEAVPLAAVDVSFISQKLVLPAVLSCLTPGGRIISLVKPQFEAGRRHVGKGGLVKDPAVHRSVLEETAAFARSLGLDAVNSAESPILGGDGNREYLMLLQHVPKGESE